MFLISSEYPITNPLLFATAICKQGFCHFLAEKHFPPANYRLFATNNRCNLLPESNAAAQNHLLSL